MKNVANFLVSGANRFYLVLTTKTVILMGGEGEDGPDHHRKGWNEMDHSRWFDKQPSEVYATNSGPMYNITINKDDDPTDEHPSYTLHSG